MATMQSAPLFDPKTDAKVLRRAMKGFGCDRSSVMDIICARSSEQRQELATMYKQIHGRDLIEDLKSELSGKFETLILGLMTPLPVYLAKEVKHAIKGLGTNEKVLVEILCTKSNAEMREIKDAYQTLYNSSMEDDVASDLSGNLKRLMVALMTANRPENSVVDTEAAQREAQALKAAGVDRLGTDESTFLSVFCSNSLAQLRAIFTAYRALAGHDIIQAVEKEMSGDLKMAYLTLVKSTCNAPRYFAEQLENAMRGLGTDDSTLIRILVSRSEIDLPQILEEYQRTYGMALTKSIEKETSGDYKRALLHILSGAPHYYSS
ncbi:annexin A13-like [Tropilaelaps mercedesae]|uniref:Annexin n=1 Tax=Tropilaelaps mercedesae TaxID=418985 RepID=A0A1V9X9V7_9ACAR|nr:annexin A13-like [Tropilaelaps mercedesae]